jgi:hypothetical protein
LFLYESGRCNATQERESTHDDNHDRVKEEANANAFISNFSLYQSWKCMKVVFFQMLEMSSFVMWLVAGGETSVDIVIQHAT